MRKIACNKNYRLLRIASKKQLWEVAPSEIHGDGVIAIRKIPKGSMVGMVAGLVSGKKSLIKTELGSYLNHCSNGNCEILKDSDKKYWCYATLDIEAGEEIAPDYRALPCPPFSRDIGFSQPHRVHQKH